MIEFTGNELEELQYCIINTYNQNHPLNLKIQKYSLMTMNQQSNEIREKTIKFLEKEIKRLKRETLNETN